MLDLRQVFPVGLRGPKPVDIEALKGRARDWVDFFFSLRDGQPGLIFKVDKWSPWHRGVPLRQRGRVYQVRLMRGGREIEIVQEGRIWQMSMREGEIYYRTGGVLFARIFAVKNAGRQLQIGRASCRERV